MFGIFLGHLILLLFGLLLLLLLLLLLVLLILLLVLLLLLLILLVLLILILVLLLVFQHLLSQGQVVTRLVVIRIVTQRLLVSFYGFLIFLHGMKNNAHVVEYLCLAPFILLYAGSIGKFVHRLLCFVLPQEGVSQVKTGNGGLGIRIQCFSVVHLGIHINTVLKSPVTFADVIPFRLLCKG